MQKVSSIPEVTNSSEQDEICNRLTPQECTKSLAAVGDALYVIGGKWKLRIIIALREDGKKRFNELQRRISGISAKVLSNELKELELNGFIRRVVYPKTPVVVEYELTSYSNSLNEVLRTLSEWGAKHRDKIKREMHDLEHSDN